MVKSAKSSSFATALLIVFLVFSLALFSMVAVYLNNIRNLQAKGDITYISPTYTRFLFATSAIFAGLSLIALLVVIFVNWPTRKGYVYRSTPAGSYLEEYSGSGETTEMSTLDVSMAVPAGRSPLLPCRPRPVLTEQQVVVQRSVPAALGGTKTTAAAAAVKRRALPSDLVSGDQDLSLYAGFDRSVVNF